MNAVELVEVLVKSGITLSVEGDQLRVRGQRGAVDPHVRESIAQHKAALLDLLRRSTNGESTTIPTITPDLLRQYEPFPLTDIQQTYLLGRLELPKERGTGCHIHVEIDDPDPDLPRLTAAWNKLLQRHAMLRAVVLPDGRQRVLEHVEPYVIDVVDLREFTAAEQTAKLDAIRDAMVNKRYEPGVWPMFQLLAVRLGELCTRIHFNIDLLVVDGASFMRLSAELRSLYENPGMNPRSPAFSFRDYVLGEAAFEQSKVMHDAEAYWNKRLADLPGAPALPTLAIPSDVHRMMKRHDAQLDAGIWKQLKERAREAGLTPTGVLATAYAEILAAWSRTAKFCLNMTIFRRLPFHPDVKELVGDFTSTILVAFDVPEAGTFIDRARALQARLTEDLNYSHFSGVRVLRELNRVRGEQNLYPFIFTSMLGLQGDDAAQMSMMQWLGKPIHHSITQTPYVLLDHITHEHQGALVIQWDAVEAAFPPGMLDDMLIAYRDFLERLANAAEIWQRPIRQSLPIPSAQMAVRTQVNATGAAISTEMLHTLFAKQVRQRPERMAVISSRKRLSYAELGSRVNQVARRLRQEGVRPGELVGVVMKKGWEQIVATLGILTSGGAYLPIDPTLPADRIHYMLQNGGVKWILSQSWLEESIVLPPNMSRLNVDEEALWSGFSSDPLESVQQPEDLAYVIYTSGTTGVPKGVMIDHRGAVNTIVDINRRFHVGPDDRVLALSLLSFDLSVYDVFGLLAAGGAIVIPEDTRRLDPVHWTELMIEEKVTLWDTVPALMEIWVDYATDVANARPDALRLVLLSGDWIPVALPDRIKALGPQQMQIIGLGGATEASIWSNFFVIGDVNPAWKSIPYGKPLTNQVFHVLDEGLWDCPVWVPGELYIGGIGLAQGYWRDEERTREKFIHHPRTGERLYRTGDFGRYLPDGNLEFLGRRDGQVKIRGHRIELSEIETVLARHPRVQSCAVVVSKSDQGRRLLAYVVPQAEQSGLPLPNSAEMTPPHGKELSNFDGVLSDPGERLEFKSKRLGLRREGLARGGISLERFQDDATRLKKCEERATHRHWGCELVSFGRFSAFLEALSEVEADGRFRRRHASAGALYPVQAYVYVKPGRIEGITEGVHYYHPVEHRLMTIGDGAGMDRHVHAADNRSIFDESAFSIFLIADMNAIAPLYGPLSRDFCLLEAGYMAQMLMSAAHESGIGLCPIGTMDFDAIKSSFDLHDRHVMLHSLVGGTVVESTKDQRKENAAQSNGDWRDFLARSLPDYMIPAAFVEIDALPVTANGKVDRKALQERPVLSEALGNEYVAPRNDVENALAAMVAELLGVKRIGTGDNFFDLGLTSVLLIRLAGRIRSEMCHELPITELFRHPTIAMLAARIRDQKSEANSFDETASRAGARRKAMLRR